MTTGEPQSDGAVRGAEGPRRSAIVFPALGPSRFADFGRFMVVNASARELFATADQVLGHSVFDALRDGGDDYSEAAQVTSFVSSLALVEWGLRTGRQAPADYCAGVSFGKLAAAAHAGVLPFDRAVRLVREIARCERDYFAEQHTDIVTHSFVKVGPETLKGLLTELTEAGVWFEVSARMDHDLTMVSLSERSLEDFKRRITESRGYSLYTMRPPAHASIFGPLRERVERDVLAHHRLDDPRLPIVSDQDGTLIETADQAARWILDGFVRPLDWPGTVRTLVEHGVDRIVIVGRDRLLRRLRSTVDHLATESLAPESALRPTG